MIRLKISKILNYIHKYIAYTQVYSIYTSLCGFLGGASGKEPTCKYRIHTRHRFDPQVGKIPGGGNGNPLQYSCLENSMDRGAWWATVHEV